MWDLWDGCEGDGRVVALLRLGGGRGGLAPGRWPAGQAAEHGGGFEVAGAVVACAVEGFTVFGVFGLQTADGGEELGHEGFVAGHEGHEEVAAG